jgi:hypothetical protein
MGIDAMQATRRGFILGVGAVFAAPAIVRASSLMPVKVLRPEPIEPWIPCDGRLLSRTRYADLFRAIGTTFGAGDTLTTFNIPDLRGRVCGEGPWPPMWEFEKRICTRNGLATPAGQIFDFFNPPSSLSA